VHGISNILIDNFLEGKKDCNFGCREDHQPILIFIIGFMLIVSCYIIRKKIKKSYNKYL